ncbi:hypothetical protein [Mucilaginibacter sp. NFX135]|uniref:hypothetical protein n=1 Tax=Mucilaginibacter sp. NFX135 TaxID=3402687 RepID=UPI003AFA30DA
MNIFTLVLLAGLSLHKPANPDTIDYWHVLYNNKIIAEYNEGDKHRVVVIKQSDVKPSDTLKVSYGMDVLDYNNKTGLYFFVKKKKTILARGESPFAPIKISVKSILAIKARYHYKYIDIYYFDNKRNQFIFRLNTE